METPEGKRYQQFHEGHCTFLVPQERRFITPATIRASGGLVGEPDEILEMLREAERAGLREVTLLPPMAGARKIFKDFAEQVIVRGQVIVVVHSGIGRGPEQVADEVVFA